MTKSKTKKAPAKREKTPGKGAGTGGKVIKRGNARTAKAGQKCPAKKPKGKSETNGAARAGTARAGNAEQTLRIKIRWRTSLVEYLKRQMESSMEGRISLSRVQLL